MEDKNPVNNNTSIDTSDSNAIRQENEVRDKAAREARERTKEKAKQEAEEAREKAKREAEEAKEAKKAEEKARKEAERAAKEKAKQEAEEAREKAKREAEEAKEAKKAEEKARKEAERAAKEKAKQEAEEAREKAKREAEEAKEAKKAEEKARKEAERAAKGSENDSFEIEIIDKGTQSIKSENIDKTAVRIGHKMFEGMVKLQIAPPVDSRHMKELEDKLRQTKGLKLMLIGGIANGGMQIVVSIKKQSPLLKILHDIPHLEEASGKGDEIHISLK